MFDNSKNQSRVANMLKLLAHVEKSAASNRATPAEIADLLAPVIDKLRAMGALPDGGDLPQPDRITRRDAPDLTAGQRMACVLAAKLSQKDLIAALLARLNVDPATLKGDAENET